MARTASHASWTIYGGRISLVLIVAIGGCKYGTENCTCQRVGNLAAYPLDSTPPPPAMIPGPRPPEPIAPPMPAPPAAPISGASATPPAYEAAAIRNVAYAAPGEPALPSAPANPTSGGTGPKRSPGRVQPLEIPSEIPGSQAPPMHLPPLQPGTSPSERANEIKALFGEMGIVEPVVGPQPSPGQPPLTLQQLQQMAIERNPLIRQAASDVDAARGAMIQAGAYPNPHMGFQADTIGTGNTAGYLGGNVSQTFVTAGKLRLAKAAAGVDLHDAQLSLGRARYDLATQVRTNYIAVLVAMERIKINNALAVFAQRVYQIQVKRVTAGQAAPYEPLQLRVLAVQAQGQLVQSNHDYEAAWRRLATNLNCPDMPPAPLAGQVDGLVPRISYESARDKILSSHTDLVIAQDAVAKAKYNLRLARVTPLCPNIDTSTTVEKDYTTPGFPTVVSLQMGVPVPIFDTNRGNIISAEAALVRACSEYDRARNELMSNLADTYSRYKTNTTTFEFYRNGILADQVRAYRGMYQRYQVDPDADFNDLVTAQQTLASTIATYVQLLGDQWQSVIDLAGLIQADDLFQMGSAGPDVTPPGPAER